MPQTNHKHLLETLIKNTAQTIHVPEDILKTYLNQHIGVNLSTQVQLLHIANKYSLDPIAGEIQLSLWKHEWSVIISIDGWIKLINQHPHFQGMSLREPSDQNANSLEWMECCIYRDDRILPIIIKEYLSEVKTEHESWQQMPRRMLRHRVIQQCARLAFGIAAPEQLKAEPVTKVALDPIHQTNPLANLEFPTPPIPRTEWLKKELSQKK
jgi:hypothetical protein